MKKSRTPIEISFDYFSAGQLKSIRKIWSKLYRILPHWLERLDIQSYSNNVDSPNAIAMTSTAEEYRLSTIEIYNGFYTEPDDRQKLAIIHEVIHIYQGSILNFVKGSLLGFIEKENKDLFQHLEAQFTKENERLTQDLAIMISELLETNS